MDIDPTALTICSAIASLHSGEFTAVSLTEACLRQIDRLNAELNAFLTPTPELAVQAALAADAILAQHPSNIDDLALLGIPVGVKDLFDTAGIRTTAGSKFHSGRNPTEDAEAVLRLKLAGASIVGKTNTHEYALGVTGVNPHYGSTRNPWNTSRISGGSSSGSAVGVAAGMCLAALGTDTGGSVRIPASLCGVVGLKPTCGRISTRGVMPLSWNLDHVGTLTRTVRDAAILLQVLAGFDPHDPASADIPVDVYVTPLDDGVKDWRIALAVGEYLETCDPHVWAGVQEAGKAFKDLGAHVEKFDLSWISNLAAANSLMTQADAAAFHHERLREHPDWFGVDVRQRLETGAATTSSEYIHARRTQVDGCRRFDIFFTKYDLLILPTTPIPAPPIDGTGALEAARQLTRFTSPFNLTGLPALSVPCGEVDGLPFGVQLVSARWQEARLLRAGKAINNN
jgi:aspartyl-tRNA(Asn)/glutamyl-tRNA(Gln) amidotransferase subunit A